MSRRSLLDHFSTLDDPRQRGKVVYPLPEIMLLVLCATLAGAEDFVEIRQWGRQKLEFLRSLLHFAQGIPSHDTLNDVMNALDGGLFSEAFTAWVEGLREDEPDIVAIDGKTSRRAKGGERHPLHVVSAWASRQRLVGSVPGGGVGGRARSPWRSAARGRVRRWRSPPTSEKVRVARPGTNNGDDDDR